MCRTEKRSSASNRDGLLHLATSRRGGHGSIKDSKKKNEGIKKRDVVFQLQAKRQKTKIVGGEIEKLFRGH